MDRRATVSHFVLLLAICNLVGVTSQAWIDCDGDGARECNPNPERATCDQQTGICECIFGWGPPPRCAFEYDACADNTKQICPDASVCVKHSVPTVYKCNCWEGYTAVYNTSDPIPGTNGEFRLVRCDGECAKDPNLCPANSVCIDAEYPAGYKCECNDGYITRYDKTKPISGTNDFRLQSCTLPDETPSASPSKLPSMVPSNAPTDTPSMTQSPSDSDSGTWKQHHSSILGMIIIIALSLIMMS